MAEKVRAYPVKHFTERKEDLAGADKVLLAGIEAACHWFENFLASGLRVHVDLWNGPNGLRGVIEEAVQNAGIPNKRFLEIMSPRAIAEGSGLIPKKRRLTKK